MFRLKVLGEEGFTFLGSLFELLILLIFLPLMVIFFSLMMSFTKETEAGLLEWQLFTSELQSYLTEIDSIEIINNGSGVRIVQQEVEYDIELNGNLVRKQKFRQGHEVMATKIKKCFFQMEGTNLLVHTEFINGQTAEAEYVYTYSK